MPISHLRRENIKRVRFPQDASQCDNDALREVWYAHEEMTNTVEFDHHDCFDRGLKYGSEEHKQVYFKKRRGRFIAQRLDRWMGEMPLEEYDSSLREEIKKVIKLEAELTDEMHDMYKKFI